MLIGNQPQFDQSFKDVLLDCFFTATSLRCESIEVFSLILNLNRNVTLAVPKIKFRGEIIVMTFQ
jgi:hypothetical protein